MAPPAIRELHRYIEQTQSQLTDPAERERALSAVERELTDALGKVQTYRNDNRRALGEDGNSDDDPGPQQPA